MSKCFAVFLLLSGSILASCGGGDRPASASNSGSDKEERATGAESLTAREVRVVRAEAGRLARTVVVSGTLAADEEAELGPKVAGRLTSLAVDLGDHVRRGQVEIRDCRIRSLPGAFTQGIDISFPRLAVSFGTTSKPFALRQVPGTIAQ